MNELQLILEAAPVLSKILYKADIMLAISNTEKYVYYAKAETLDAQIKHEQPLLENDVLSLAIIERKIVVHVSPPDFPIRFKASNYSAHTK